MKEYYFDHSATSNPKPKIVIDRVCDAMMNLNGNAGRSAYKKAIDISREIFKTRAKIAKFFNIENPLQIAFTSNSTMSLNIAIKGLGLENCHVITSVLEHNSVLRPLHFLEDEKNVSLSFLEPKENKNELINDFISLIREDTKAVVLNHVSNLTGFVMDIETIGKICKERKITFIVDASQSAGFLPIDVRKSYIDILCFTGHKSLLGIQGIGGLYVYDKVKLLPLLEGGTGSYSKLRRQPQTMPEILECGTLNVPGIISISAGIDYINSIGLEKIKEHEEELTRLFIDEISKIENIKIYGDKDSFRGPVVSINMEGISSSELAVLLDDEFQIAVRSGYHCAPLAHRFYGTYEDGAVRFSFSYSNTTAEIFHAVRALKEISKYVLENK